MLDVVRFCIFCNSELSCSYIAQKSSGMGLQGVGAMRFLPSGRHERVLFSAVTTPTLKSGAGAGAGQRNQY